MYACGGPWSTGCVQLVAGQGATWGETTQYVTLSDSWSASSDEVPEPPRMLLPGFGAVDCANLVGLAEAALREVRSGKVVDVGGSVQAAVKITRSAIVDAHAARRREFDDWLMEALRGGARVPSLL